MKKTIDLMQKTVALVVTFSSVGNRRKVHSGQIEVDADKAWLAVSKKLIECDEYEAIGRLDSEVKSYLDARALPSLLKRGIYLLPIPMVKDVDDQLRRYVELRKECVERLIVVYRKHVDEAEGRLRELFERTDYATPEQLHAGFSLTWQFTSFNTPASLQQVSRELYEKEKEKNEALWKDANEACQQLLRQNMGEMVDKLVDKLTPGEDGKKKIFRNTAITNIQEFLSTFDMRNVTDDSKLKAIVDKARALLSGVDPEQLRTEEGLRDAVRNGFEKIQSSMSGMIEVKPKRAISLEDVA